MQRHRTDFYNTFFCFFLLKYEKKNLLRITNYAMSAQSQRLKDRPINNELLLEVALCSLGKPIETMYHDLYSRKCD